MRVRNDLMLGSLELGEPVSLVTIRALINDGGRKKKVKKKKHTYHVQWRDVLLILSLSKTCIELQRTRTHTWDEIDRVFQDITGHTVKSLDTHSYTYSSKLPDQVKSIAKFEHANTTFSIIKGKRLEITITKPRDGLLDLFKSAVYYLRENNHLESK